MINCVTDPRTALSHFVHFEISNHQLMIDLMHYFRRHEPAEILDISDISERVNLFLKHGEYAELQIRKNAKVRGKTVVVDLRQEDTIYACNCFMIYALYTGCN